MGRIRSAVVIALFCFGVRLQADTVEPLPFTEGSVWEMSFVKVKPGFEEDYLRSLGQTWKKVMDEAKKQKLVVSYKVLSADAAARDDWNVALMVEYKNMAALDGLEEKMRSFTLPMLGGQDKARELQTKRLEIRDIVASKLTRELVLK
ncbi:MAG TPA: hypothetical protein VG496_02270 [Myxococcales bacterium]|nr:hypothetical protein [Myxococcales bacterium]